MKELEYPFDSDYIVHYKKKLRRELLSENRQRLKKRIAVFGGSTTDDLVKTLDLFLLNSDIEAEFYQSKYAKYYEDALFSNEELDSFHPDLIYIYITNRNIMKFPTVLDSEQLIHEMISNECEKLTRMWESIKSRFHCPVIQNNFELPCYRLLGNMDGSDIHGKVNFISRLNNEVYTLMRKTDGVYLCDLHYISADYGLNKWHNQQCWYMYKYAIDISAIPYLSYNVANIIKAIYGKSKKGFVLDLDNTLWGGVVGDDGVENLEIGQESAVGQAYYEFQHYLKEHRDRGLVLTVDSKNDKDNAVEGLNNAECVLHTEDFAILKANWNPKDLNFEMIAQELNLLPESLVFVDDNPAEREIIKKRFPNVAVPDIKTVQSYIATIDRSGYFEAVSISNDDLNRNKMYLENIEREKLKTQFTDYKDYLKSLQMTAEINKINEQTIPRVAQLVNKTNQFNLTTRRYSQEEIEAMARNDEYICLYGKLNDKFGENGVVTVVIGKIEGGQFHIELWLMSCRVLKRNLEYAMMDELVKICTEKGIGEIIGYYYPTAKNNMVKDLYAELGMTIVTADADGNLVWRMKPEQYIQLNDVIEVNGNLNTQRR